MIYITTKRLNRNVIADIFDKELTFFRVTNTTMVLTGSKVVIV